ncbi:MAG: hypothetical protein AVDCRST_MAG07-322 [uncultured Frankineae bacterium]|uniref:Uncharacterized protein n=1 Tax=uncultured Frankineae bacterium TaxID=437475 RepID=A0A6J4KLB6_9ACTN|nr:MAG: hypothetical protein AVDCRST_MAG07-322 [uncultured Frankineae bacterium]
MPLFARRARPEPAPLRLVVPRLDGTGWPDRAVVGRPTFDAAAYHEMGTRRAYEPEAHAVADTLVPAALERIRTGAGPDDEPYLVKVFVVAARVGTGIGLVDREQAAPGSDVLDRAVAGALWQARRELPAMREDWARTAGWFLLAGHRLGRQGPGALPVLLDGLPAA